MHWSGHKSRLDRDLSHRFGTKAYAAEELVAELGAAFLCAHLGVQGQLRHAGYIDSWLSLLKEDDRAIFTAASKASAAADYLRSFSEKTEQAKEVIEDIAIARSPASERRGAFSWLTARWWPTDDALLCRRRLQFRKRPNLDAHARRLRGGRHHFARRRIANQCPRLARRHLAKRHFQKARQSELADTPRVNRPEKNILQRRVDADGGLARNVVLFGDQVDERRLRKRLFDSAESPPAPPCSPSCSPPSPLLL